MYSTTLGGILQRFWPEVKNFYLVEHFLMTNSEILRYETIYLVDIFFLVLFLIDNEEIKSHEIQAAQYQQKKKKTK